MEPFARSLLALRDLLPGRVLRGTGGARYHLRERIGEGGQGWVFTATCNDPGGYVVIAKVLRPDVVTAESLGRFEREARVLRMLGQTARPNPHIVRFFDHAIDQVSLPGTDEAIRLPFTVLEFVRGPTLEQVLARSRGAALALERIRHIGGQIVLALGEVHAHSVVHRDLKPSNVLLAQEGGSETAKVTDFGLVKVADVGLGRTSALAGATLGYAPPEQFERGNQRVSPRTDVFSFAAMLYEMLSGVKAFPHEAKENPLVIVARLLNGPRPSLARTDGMVTPELATRADLVEALDAQLARATAAEPSERHATMADLWGAVEPLLREGTERRRASSGGFGEGLTRLESAPAPPRPKPDRRGPAFATERHSSMWPDDEAHLANPAAWQWRVRVGPNEACALRAAVFDPGGEAAYATGASGLMRWQAPGWTRVSTSPPFDASRVRGLVWLPPGELVAFGLGGLVGRLTPGGQLEIWDVPERDVTLEGAHADERGRVTVVGHRPVRRAAPAGGRPTSGAIAQFTHGKLTMMCDAPNCTRLRGVTRLRAGAVVACGDGGALVRLELGVPQYVGPVCGGHLHAIGPLHDGGAVTIGEGGHALSLSPTFGAQLEAVQTTRDLYALAIDPAGVPWAGSAQARLLRRTAGSWVRMSGELGLASSVVALWAAPRTVRAICDDGAVIEGNASG